MKKIPTLFKRNMDTKPALVYNEINPGCEWVMEGQGVPTVKTDGTCCLIDNGALYKRHELKPGKVAPDGFVPAQGADPNTGKQPGWVPVGDGPEDKWHREAFVLEDTWTDGTYELMGPKINGNPENYSIHMLGRHGLKLDPAVQPPHNFDDLKDWLERLGNEGIVWHHPDGRMAKLKRRDFGYPWPVKK